MTTTETTLSIKEARQLKRNLDKTLEVVNELADYLEIAVRGLTPFITVKGTTVTLGLLANGKATNVRFDGRTRKAMYSAIATKPFPLTDARLMELEDTIIAYMKRGA